MKHSPTQPNGTKSANIRRLTTLECVVSYHKKKAIEWKTEREELLSRIKTPVADSTNALNLHDVINKELHSLDSVTGHISAMLDVLIQRTEYLQDHLGELTQLRQQHRDRGSALMVIRRALRGDNELRIDPDLYAERVLSVADKSRDNIFTLLIGGPERSEDAINFLEALEALSEEEREGLDNQLEKCMDEWKTQFLEITGIQPFARMESAHEISVTPDDHEMDESRFSDGEHVQVDVDTSISAAVTNLKSIKGIGNSYAKKLIGLGVCRLDQIANWTDEDIALFDTELNTNGQIKNEEWVSQAIELIAAKNGSPKIG